MGIFEGDPAGDRIKYNADVPMAAAKGIRSAVAMVGSSLRAAVRPRQRQHQGCQAAVLPRQCCCKVGVSPGCRQS